MFIPEGFSDPIEDHGMEAPVDMNILSSYNAAEVTVGLIIESSLRIRRGTSAELTDQLFQGAETRYLAIDTMCKSIRNFFIFKTVNCFRSVLVAGSQVYME